MRKTYLLTPGPTPIPERIYATFATPILHHRTPEFEELFSRVRKNLQSLFQTKNDVLVLACTGTGAMEAALINVVSPGDEILTLNAGKFGERWTLLGQKLGMTVHELKVDPGVTPEPKEIETWMAAHPKAKAVFFQASETSTGVMLPTQAICSLARAAGLLSICDAITACGVFDLPVDQWGIDVLITGSQKAFMIPPGLAMISLSDQAWSAVENSKTPRFYFDLRKERKAQSKNQTAWTPAISLIQGLDVALDMLHREGLQNTFKRHEVLAAATRAGVTALGLELLAKKNPSTAVTAVKVPSSISDGKKIPKYMRENLGVTITGGQDELEGKIFRLSHFGYCGPFDIITGLSALELTLKHLGHPFTLGSAVKAALEVFSASRESAFGK